MTLQESVEFDQFVRCYCIGQEEVMIMAYDPRKPYLSGEQYVYDPNYLSPELTARVVHDVRTLLSAWLRHQHSRVRDLDGADDCSSASGADHEVNRVRTPSLIANSTVLMSLTKR